MSAQHIATPDNGHVLAKALINAGRALGFTQHALAQVVGKDRTSFTRGIAPDTKPGELSLLFIRVYRSLFALVGGNADDMRHWIQTYNTGTGGIPAEQVKTISGLTHVLAYLDAMRAKI